MRGDEVEDEGLVVSHHAVPPTRPTQLLQHTYSHVTGHVTIPVHVTDVVYF